MRGFARLKAIGLCCTAIGVAPGVYAQAPGPSSASAQAQGSSERGLEEIIVTAQRREQKLQDVPVAVAAVSALAAQRAGVTSTESLTIAVPGLQFSRQTSNGAAPFLRGVGSTQAAIGSESPVATYVDDVYIGASNATAMAFNNIERIEVLKGPQGTLFGRNATGGVVHVHTRRPSQERAMDMTLGYGNFGTVDASAFVNSGLTETLAFNVAAVAHYQRDGYGLNLTTGNDIYYDRHYGARGALLWEPGTDTKLFLTADYLFTDSDLGANPSVLPGRVSSGGGVYRGRYREMSGFDDEATSTSYGFSARLDHDFGWARFASITGIRKAILEPSNDLDGGPPLIYYSNGVHATTATRSQEIQLLAPSSSRLQWILGAFYYHSVAQYNPTSVFGSAAGPTGHFLLFSKQNLNSYAGFGEINYEVLENTNITLGGRYTTDRYRLSASKFDDLGRVFQFAPFTVKDSFSKFTYRAVLDHHFTPDVMAYASYNRGFKSGGYNVSAPNVGALPAPVVRPEVLDAYEVGLKTELLDRRLRLNVAGFLYDYTNMQVTVIGLGTSTTVNAASARIKGFDLDFEAVPVRNLTLTGGFSILDANFRSFPNGPFIVANPANCATLQQTGPATGGNTSCSADLSGNRTPRAPKFTASLVGTYVVESAAGDFSFTGSVYRNSGYFWEPDNVVRAPDHTLLGATIGWTSPDKHLQVQLWGKNLTDAYYATYGGQTAFRTSESPAPPRTYGVTVGAHF